MLHQCKDFVQTNKQECIFHIRWQTIITIKNIFIPFKFKLHLSLNSLSAFILLASGTKNILITTCYKISFALQKKLSKLKSELKCCELIITSSEHDDIT